MEKATLTFEEVCRYAELTGHKHREEPSKAKDYTGQFFKSCWSEAVVMVLYEAPRRTPRGKDKPEVMWWVIDSEGEICGLYSRNIRLMTPAKGLGISSDGYDKITWVLRKHTGGLLPKYESKKEKENESV